MTTPCQKTGSRAEADRGRDRADDAGGVDAGAPVQPDEQAREHRRDERTPCTSWSHATPPVGASRTANVVTSTSAARPAAAPSPIVSGRPQRAAPDRERGSPPARTSAASSQGQSGRARDPDEGAGDRGRTPVDLDRDDEPADRADRARRRRREPVVVPGDRAAAAQVDPAVPGGRDDLVAGRGRGVGVDPDPARVDPQERLVQRAAHEQGRARGRPGPGSRGRRRACARERPAGRASSGSSASR